MSSVRRSEFNEDAYADMVKGILEEALALKVSEFLPGEGVMLVRLKTLENNGLLGVVIESDDPARVGVRLHDGRELKAKPCNVFLQGQLVAVSRAPSCLPFYEHCSVEREEGKGLGVMAVKPLRKGTVLSDPSLCGDNVNVVMMVSSVEGWMWKAHNYLGQTRIGNVAEWEGSLDKVHASLEEVLVAEKYNCTHNKRFTSSVCTIGGCSYCGPSGMTSAASHGMQLAVFREPQHHLNVLRHGFVVNEQQMLAFLQPVDILYIANCVAVALREVPLDDAVQEEFVEYAWELVGVWITNSFYNMHSVNDMRAVHDHSWPFVRLLHQEHMHAWSEWRKGVKKTRDSPAALDAQLRLVEARYDATWDLLEQLDTPEAPVLGSDQVVQTCDAWCVVELCGAPITRLNGAIPGIDTPKGIVADYLRHKITTLTVTADVAAGAFLKVSYNPGLAADSPLGYFKTVEQPFLLATRCRERAGLRAVVAQLFAGCGPLLSRAVRAHLEACAR